MSTAIHQTRLPGPSPADRPWRDRAGRFSPLHAAAFVFAVLPALLLAFGALTSTPDPRPFDAAIHESGEWAVRLLLLTLALTPLRRISGWTRWIAVRRMLGVAAFSYALGHLVLFVGQQGWDVGHATSEIVQRVYLAIGFVTLAGLAVLAATSTDAAIRRLGRRWRSLHKIVHVLAILGLLHFFLQSKSNVSDATLMMGLFVLLAGHRLALAAGFRLNDARILARPPCLRRWRRPGLRPCGTGSRPACRGSVCWRPTCTWTCRVRRTGSLSPGWRSPQYRCCDGCRASGSASPAETPSPGGLLPRPGIPPCLSAGLRQARTRGQMRVPAGRAGPAADGGCRWPATSPAT
ncbi:MAG: ferric reductase-like transmembrane domain-containing protein [Pseudomonadota bacterium]|nr:ferric reductase-like transmembrane domain-containing protein [Pseudomonadota bacterium]